MWKARNKWKDHFNMDAAEKKRTSYEGGVG
jgi:hypothetical protein